MAGIGVKLNKIYEKNTITTNLIGLGYSTMVTIAPMFLVIATVLIMGWILGLNSTGYAARQLLSCTLLYIFVFSLFMTAPFSAVLSRYLSDVIYEEKYEDILPCFYVGLILNVGLGVVVGIPFCMREYLVGGVDLLYVFTGYCGYMALILVLYSMLYLSIFKDYQKISAFYLSGMIGAVLFSLLCAKVFGMETTYAMLLGLTIGFLMIAGLNLAMVKCYFKSNSGNYRKVLGYFRMYWKLAVINFLYILGLYIHNFVYWGKEMHVVIENSFVCYMPYDMATCLAMFTNISMTLISTTRLEMYFHERYKSYSEAVIGGRLMDIENAKKRMFQQLGSELLNMVRIQFIISVVLYLACVVLLPQLGISGLTMEIYPGLAAGYFILFLMYTAIIYLYYFNDLTGALLTAFFFCIGTFVGTMFASMLAPLWYGMGLVGGAFLGWTLAYMRLRWTERNLDEHIFCNGKLMKQGKGEKPSSKVLDRSKTVTFT